MSWREKMSIILIILGIADNKSTDDENTCRSLLDVMTRELTNILADIKDIEGGG